MIPIGIKDYVYGGVILAVISALFWWHHRTIVIEDQRLALAQQQAVQTAIEQTDARLLKDAQNAAATIDNLQHELDILRAGMPRTAPVMRLCGYANSPGPLPPSRNAPSEAASGTAVAGGVRGVLPGDTEGADIGSAVLDLAYSAAIVAAYRNATVKWAMEQQK